MKCFQLKIKMFFLILMKKRLLTFFILFKCTLFDKASCKSTNMLIMIKHAMLVVWGKVSFV